MLAKGTGWSERYIRWDLPSWRAYAYLHAMQLQLGINVIWADRTLDPEVMAFRAFKDEMMKVRRIAPSI